MGFFILDADGKTPIQVDLITWGKWFEVNPRRVALDEFDGVKVSTVFLGMDHGIGEGDPVLWETMVFGGEHDGHEDRYTSHEAAMAGHATAVALVKGVPA